MKYLIALSFAGALLAGCSTTIKPTTRIEFDAPDVYPEGVAYDAGANVFYVTSFRKGTIGKVDRQGNYSILLADSNFKSAYGIKVHPDGKRIFVCVADANHSKYQTPDTKKKMARLVSIDIASGKKLTDTDLSGLLPGNHFPNDLTFDDKGNIYITDSYAAAIYRVTPDGKASVFAKDKKFETEGVGLNGIVFHPSGYLLVDNSNNGQIFKIDINSPQNVQKVDISQYFLGADGLLLKDNKLVVVTNGGNDKIFELASDNNWKSAKVTATTLGVDRFTHPATATYAGDEIWVMNAKTGELTDSNDVPSKKFAIQLAKLKPIPKI